MSTWVERVAPIREKLALLSEAGDIRKDVTQSDKIGSDWVNIYVNDVLVRQEYIEQDNPVGTADNPFAYSASVPMIPNGFYIKDDVRKVWTGNYRKTPAAWSDERFVEF